MFGVAGEKRVSRHDLEWEFGLSGEEMSILREQGVRPHPFRIGGDERVGRFKSSEFVLVPKLKRHDAVLIDLSQSLHDPKKVAGGFGSEMTQDFLDNGAGDADTVFWCRDNQLLEQCLAGGLGEQP